ncbi:C1q-related factor-like [Mercenaria mercenaria]|uniref:C1q-related factor-like n=1 Tax=Mercenaria mercenaria TaxID=6596 RepID=UPI00234E7154|nr:C1q-related factor-like [Mercenaria mercenaria]
MKAFQVLSFVLLLFILGTDTSNVNSQNMPQTASNQANIDLIEEKIKGIREVYDDKLNKMYEKLTLTEKRYSDLQRQYSNLAEIVRGFTRKRGLLDSRSSQTTTSSHTQPKIAFYAQLTQDKTALGDHQPIEFDMVTTNIGNAYNKADGMFTAPVPGTYVFSWTAANHIRSFMWSQLVINGLMHGKTLTDSADHISVASNTVVVNLKAGDVVWIRTMADHSHRLMGSQLSTFSGWLLYSD